MSPQLSAGPVREVGAVFPNRAGTASQGAAGQRITWIASRYIGAEDGGGGGGGLHGVSILGYNIMNHNSTK